MTTTEGGQKKWIKLKIDPLVSTFQGEGNAKLCHFWKASAFVVKGGAQGVAPCANSIIVKEKGERKEPWGNKCQEKAKRLPYLSHNNSE